MAAAETEEENATEVFGIYGMGESGRKNTREFSDLEGIFYENTDMFAEDVTMELDAAFRDENGNGYSYISNEGTMVFDKIGLKNYDMTQDYVEIRVPDKVIFRGKEYRVTGFEPSFDAVDNEGDSIKFKFYIGKYIENINDRTMNCQSAFSVHPENVSFSSEQGSLFRNQKEELVKFYDGIYTRSSVCTLPQTVRVIGEYAFAGTRVKEVVFGDAVTKICDFAFEKSQIQRIDLNQVKEVGYRAFARCELLGDLIIRQEGVLLKSECFNECQHLQYLYLPAHTELWSKCFKSCIRLEVIIVEEGCGIGEEAFALCIDLRILILPDSMNDFYGDMLLELPSLKILYLPSNLKQLGGNLEEGEYALTFSGIDTDSPGKEWAERCGNITFKDLSEHVHQWKKVTFFELDLWGITGNYCEDCGKGETIERITWPAEEDKGELPPLLQEEYEGQECLELDHENKDELGLVYSLDQVRKTAEVISYKKAGYHNEIWCIPAMVKKDGEIYAVEKISISGFGGWRGGKLILPDTVREVQGWFWGIRYLKIGAGLRTIKDYTYIDEVGRIEVSEDNKFFCAENNVLYNKDKTKLICVASDGTGRNPVFTVPHTVTEIQKFARFGGYIQKVRIYNNENVDIEDGVYFGEDVQTEYLEWGESLDENNTDSYGRKYTLDENSRTAAFTPEDLSVYEGKELTTPYKVEKDGDMYVVDGISFEQVKVVNKEKVVLKIEKYIRYVEFGEQKTNLIYCDVNWENPCFRQIKGTLLSVSWDTLYNFYDGDCQPGDEYRLPLQVQKIDDGAFRGACIAAVLGGEQLTYIGRGAFADCSYLEELKLQKDGVEIGDDAFMDCVRLKNMYFPKKTVAGDGIFRNCPGLLRVVLDQGTEWEGEEGSGIFYGTECYSHQDMEEHTHSLREVTFFCYKNWGVKGKYCETCACGTDYELVTFSKEEDRAFMPALLEKTANLPTSLPEESPYPVTGESTEEPERTPLPPEKPEKTPQTPAPTNSVKPAETQMPEATVAPNEADLEPEESSGPGEESSAEPSRAPTNPSVTLPTNSPISLPEESPGVSYVPSIVPISGAEPPQNFLSQFRQKLEVKGFQVSSTKEKTVKLCWNRNMYAKCYQIYRASSKNGNYKLVKMVSKSRVSHVDEGVQTNKKYYYKIRALGVWEKQLVEGGESRVCSIYNAGLRIPVILVKKGRMDSVRYITIVLKRYAGERAEIYISLKNKKFKNLKLVSNKIARYKARFKIRYVVKSQEIRVKVRTYSKVGKKKIYSKFSKVVRVHV